MARNLRSPALGDEIDGDIFLHRLLLKSRGQPLWEYRSEKELLQGIRAALSGTPSFILSLSSLNDFIASSA